MTNEKAMLAALEEAARAIQHGDVPIGAIVIYKGKIIAARHNEKELRQDPTAHAEILALQDAAKELKTWRLTEASLVATLEPCVMCAGAAVSARVAEVIFGAYDPKAGACGSLYNPGADARLNHEFKTTGGVLEEECSKLLTDFFSSRRNAEL